MDIDPPAPPSSAPKKLKFTPKAPPRRKTGPLLPKSDSSDDDAEAAPEFVRKVNQRLGGARGPKVQKKCNSYEIPFTLQSIISLLPKVLLFSPGFAKFQHAASGNVTMSLGDGSSSTQLRTRGQPKDRNNKNSLDLRESAEKSIMLSSSTATKDGDIDENPSSLADDRFESSSKTKKEYKEPWDYDKYYPISLPWRRPGSGNPELLNAQEFGQEKEYDENKINSALELGLLENSEKKQLILFQFPPKLPLNKQTHRVPDSSKGKEKVESSSSLKEDASNKCSDLKELPDGFMGKMLVYKSGAIKFKLGDTTFDVSFSDSTFSFARMH